MIRYRRLYESENSDIKLYDVVRCAGYEWFVIGIEDDIVTLLAKNADFGKTHFDDRTNEYCDSYIRRYLQNDVLPKLFANGVNPIPTRLRDVRCEEDIWLLSSSEARRLPKKIRKFPKWWWLRTPCLYIQDSAECVYNNEVGTFAINSRWEDEDDYGYDLGYVRPAMRVKLEDLG